MKARYVKALRVLRSALAATGVLAVLDRAARRSRTALWVRSWLAIYDLDDLVALDAPWWTFEAADAVERFLAGRRGARVFEWGSGASTVWLSRRGAVVHSVEHDAAWAEQMADVLPPSATLRLVPAVPAGPPSTAPGTPPGASSAKPGFEALDFTAYVAAIDDVPGPLDLVVIDGRARAACLDRAIGRLAPGGLIVLDNVERARYRAALARHGADLEVRWTRGRTPTLPYPTRTALVSRRTAPA